MSDTSFSKGICFFILTSALKFIKISLRFLLFTPKNFIFANLRIQIYSRGVP